MSDACTIISPVRGFQEVVDVLKRHKFPEFEIAGRADRWDSIRVPSAKGELVFNSLIRIKPGDKFSRLVLGMRNFIRTRGGPDTAIKQQLATRISEAQWMVGVVGTPEFLDEDGHLDLILGISRKLDSVIFNGSAILDSNGEILLQGSDGD